MHDVDGKAMTLSQCKIVTKSRHGVTLQHTLKFQWNVHNPLHTTASMPLIGPNVTDHNAETEG